ncbi:Gustatory receptor 74b [Hyalella azteca]|uniref:Gustatory receptor 74b n=1 Tax=Hyalella azteca TaxID=294128 RepID=A0A6A0GPY1_HYAAZ|nr:Gustatory receptor 74b [Hyalella azteca]
MNNKNLLHAQIYFLRLIGLSPYERNGRNYQLSQAKLGFSIIFNILLAVMTLTRVSSIGTKKTDNIYDTLKLAWVSARWSMTLAIRWAFLFHAVDIVKFLNILSSIKETCLNINRKTYTLIALLLTVVVHQNYRYYIFHRKETNQNLDGISEQWLGSSFLGRLSVCIISNLFLWPYLTLPLFLYTLMIQATSLLHQALEKLNETSDAKDLSAIMKKVRNYVLKVKRSIELIHKSFMEITLLILAYVQLELVMIVLYAMYDSSSLYAEESFFVLLPTFLELWLFLNCQSGYIYACEDGIHRVKKLIAEVGLKGSEHVQEVWHLRGIQAELERMPRFTIFGLFELGRHCLLSMGSIVLTYVIIAIQFTTSNNPVTCKPFNFTDGSTSA